MLTVDADDMDLTMLRQTARRGRLEAMLKDSTSQIDESSRLVSQLAQILQPETRVYDPLKPLTGLESAQMLAHGREIAPDIYRKILQYLHFMGQTQWRAAYQAPHLLDDNMVLPPRSLMPSEIKQDGQTFSCKRSHEGNSGIRFNSPTNPATPILTGYIENIYQIPLQGHLQTFILVQKHMIIPQWVRQRAPFHTMPHLNTSVVDAAPSDEFCIIEPEHILTHLTIYKRPKGTYGIDTRDLLVICWSLNRGRRSRI